ncbi:HTS1 [Sanghuangporus sanghuang]
MMEALTIDPFDSDHWLYGTGDGIEETAIQALLSPPVGPNLLSAVYDLEGFVHTDLTEPPAAAYSNPTWSGAVDLDYAGNQPLHIVRIGNDDSSSGKQVAISTGSGATWSQDYGAADGVNGGKVAFSADGDTVLWRTSANGVQVSQYTNPFTSVPTLPNDAQIASDKKNNSVSYGASVTPNPNVSGDVWVSTDKGLFHSLDFGATWTQLPDITQAWSISLGAPAETGGYPALFAIASFGSQAGYFRSDDQGVNWVQINDASLGFGAYSANVISGDPRVYGRVYIGTNGRGIFYGDASGMTPAPTATAMSAQTSAPITSLPTSTQTANRQASTSTVLSTPVTIMSNAPSSTAIANVYGQCGGTGWTGPTVCASGLRAHTVMLPSMEINLSSSHQKNSPNLYAASRPSEALLSSITTISAEESLAQEISEQSRLVAKLKSDSSAQAVAALEEAKRKLAELKKKENITRNAANGGNDAGKRKERLLLKTAKGTRDYGPSEMFCREHVERIVKDVFTAYGGSQLDTPIFERKDILTDKYGEDSKLIFDLMDQGGEQLSLRYDHTVPLARYLAMTLANNPQSKIWQVGKVYRRDNPVMSKGRMREFSQADFDISGIWDSMIPDAEILSVLCTILTRLDVGEFTIKLNNRKILDGVFEVCGVPPEKIRSISSAVDKLDKLPWSEVKKEMTEEKGLDPVVADKIGEYVKRKGGEELLGSLLADSTLTANARAKEGLSEMSLLLTLLKSYKVIDKISFDMSLARGLDYYTGIIYEAIVAASAPPGFKADATAEPTEAPKPQKKSAKKTKGQDEEDEIDESTVGVGSIAAGGRYDNLVGSLISAAAGSDKKSAGVPCVGVSIGLDRIFAILYPKWLETGLRQKEVLAFVMAAGDGLLEERIKLVTELREAGIKADFLAKKKPKLPTQFAAGEKDEVPFAIILGDEELKEGLVTVKEQKWEMKDGKKTKIESADKGVKIKRAELIDWLKSSQVYKDWQVGIW